jgi:hypothetical protein
MTLAAAPPHEALWGLANSIVASRSLHVVAELGVADHIDEQPVPADELARRCGTEANALDRVLRLCAAHGIFARESAGWAHTAASRLLRTDHLLSMRAFARLNGLPVVVGALGALDHAVRTGAPAVEVLHPAGFFDYLQSHPGEAAVFQQAMAAKAGHDIAAILGAYDFRPFGVIADIGGGRGHLLHAVLQATPSASGVLFDLPDVVARVDLSGERLRTQAGDFFEDPLPPADAYLLMEVIHDWPDEQVGQILRAIRAAAAPGATVLVIEDLASEDGTDVRSLTLDVVMLAVTGGRERTPSQHAELLRRAGFRHTRVIDTDGAMRVVEGVAV